MVMMEDTSVKFGGIGRDSNQITSHKPAICMVVKIKFSMLLIFTKEQPDQDLQYLSFHLHYFEIVFSKEG